MVGDLYSPPAPRRRVDRATRDREIKPVGGRVAAADGQGATAAPAGGARAGRREMTRRLGARADAVGGRRPTVHRAAEIEIARHGERQRAEFLRGLVFGSVAPAEIRRLGPAYHLTPDLRYVALRGRPAPGTSPEQLVRAITAAVRAGGQHGFVDILEGDVVGVAPRAPELDGV